MKRLLAVLAILAPLAPLPASALSITVPAGYSDNWFDISGNTRIDIIAGAWLYPVDWANLCDLCVAGFYDGFTVNYFAGANLLQTTDWHDQIWSTLHWSDHAAGMQTLISLPPDTADRLEIINFLEIAHLLDTTPDRPPLTHGDIYLFSYGVITPVVPIPPALPLFATAVAAMLWRRR